MYPPSISYSTYKAEKGLAQSDAERRAADQCTGEVAAALARPPRAPVRVVSLAAMRGALGRRAAPTVRTTSPLAPATMPAVRVKLLTKGLGPMLNPLLIEGLHRYHRDDLLARVRMAAARSQAATTALDAGTWSVMNGAAKAPVTWRERFRTVRYIFIAH
jgi:hypothetical protein